MQPRRLLVPRKTLHLINGNRRLSLSITLSSRQGLTERLFGSIRRLAFSEVPWRITTIPPLRVHLCYAMARVPWKKFHYLKMGQARSILLKTTQGAPPSSLYLSPSPGRTAGCRLMSCVTPFPLRRPPISVRIIRSEEHTSELQSPYVISYAVFCLKKK